MKFLKTLKARLQKLSFRTGLFVLGLAILFYAVSFGQMFLGYSAATKGILWAVFFGLAKTAQYTAILIIGAEGIKRLRKKLSK